MRHPGHIGAGCNKSVSCLHPDGEAVVLLRDVVEEVATLVGMGGAVFVAIDTKEHVDIGDGVVVGGVEEEMAVGKIDKEWLFGRGNAIEDQMGRRVQRVYFDDLFAR